ncbi:MAG TPA: MFS transporter [Candidatus Brocadiia bacterium]|nr:MFS transporter [Candidatus Brocadiia bacterium]
MPWLVVGNAFNAIFCELTVFGSVFVLFLDEMKLPKARIGVVLSLIPFCGVMSLFVAPKVERFGLKKTFVTFFSLRKLFILGLLFLPAVKEAWGGPASFYFVVAMILGFAICRAISETAIFPWSQEMVPVNMRGKFSAINSIVSMLAQSGALLLASQVLKGDGGVGPFLNLFALGTVCGLVCAVCHALFPGGGPSERTRELLPFLREAFAAMKDRNFALFNLGVTTLVFAYAPLAFAPLYFKELTGIRESSIILLSFASLMGSMLSSYLWGWSSDRYGSKPVMIFGLLVLALRPAVFYFLPSHSAWSEPLAFASFFVWGIAVMAWAIGSGRYLLVTVVPLEKRTPWLALYYASQGVANGLGPLVSGWILSASEGLSGRLGFLHVDPYTPAFIFSGILGVVGTLMIAGLRARGEAPASRFVGMFMRGNPLSALESMVRYSFARSEHDRIATTQAMGDARSPLSVEELTEALKDPSFNVRYEAIVSIARTRSDPRLIYALLHVLVDDEPELHTATAWALGRLGDSLAILPLREVFLSSEYALLRARCARALAQLGDRSMAPRFLEVFRKETVGALRLAYASALGQLRVAEALPEMLAFMASVKSESARMEMALALARMVDMESYFVSLWRRTRVEAGTPLSQAVNAARRKLARAEPGARREAEALEEAERLFARDSLDEGAGRLAEAAPASWMQGRVSPSGVILAECALRLKQHASERREYLLAALTALEAELRDRLAG